MKKIGLTGKFLASQRLLKIFTVNYLVLLLPIGPMYTNVCTATVQQGPIVSNQHRERLVLPVAEEEVKQAVWSIGGDKAPGPDGFRSQFYKDCWDIINMTYLLECKNFYLLENYIKLGIQRSYSYP